MIRVCCIALVMVLTSASAARADIGFKNYGAKLPVPVEPGYYAYAWNANAKCNMIAGTFPTKAAAQKFVKNCKGALALKGFFFNGVIFYFNGTEWKVVVQ